VLLAAVLLTACTGSADAGSGAGSGDSRPAPGTLRVTCTQGTGIDVATEQVPTSVTFVVMHRQHSEYTYGGVQPSPNGGWATWVDGTCDPDRLPSAS
jgi:hypothetical protein